MAPNIVDGGIETPLAEEKSCAASQLMVPQVEKRIDSNESHEASKNKNENSGWLNFEHDIKWVNVVAIIAIHIWALHGFIYFPYIQKWYLIMWSWMWGMLAAFGVTGGIHRYWTHRSYKANTPLKIFVTFCFLSSGQNSLYNWVRDHRVHHKFSETDADPHNSNRGLFFSHVGWLMLKKHPEVLKKGKQIDMSDIVNDPVAAFAERHFVLLKLLLCFVIPITFPVLAYGEDWYDAIVTQVCRYVYVLNATWSVNSFAHVFGNKPYDKEIAPSENKYVSYVSLGEGWHNYHHAFPSDYRAAEIGGNRFNWTTRMIDMFANIGWAYDRKEPSESLIRMTIEKRGDGSHESRKKELADSGKFR